jgi:predicted RecA/RadA family phage recombinase
MAKNQVIYGTSQTRVLPSAGALTAGDPYYLNGVLYVALCDASGAAVDTAFAIDGVWTLPATALEAWTKGDALYWDPGTSKLTNVAGALVRVGTAYAAKSNGASYTTGQCDLQVGA